MLSPVEGRSKLGSVPRGELIVSDVIGLLLIPVVAGVFLAG